IGEVDNNIRYNEEDLEDQLYTCSELKEICINNNRVIKEDMIEKEIISELMEMIKIVQWQIEI
ncbi:3951_t:CDS:2, partial [Diversispora eburnea]